MKRILFFGNSLTAGYGLSNAQEQSFPSLIQQKINESGLQYECINAGVSGDTSASGLARLGLYLPNPMDIFVLELGANDMIRGINPKTTEDNLQRIVDRVKAAHPEAQLMLLGMQLPLWVPGERAAEFRMLYSNMAIKNQMTFVPFLLEGVAGIRHLNMHDGIHPLAEGYVIIAQKVWPVLKPLLR
ncbi:arylesterase [Pedobacter faecalis]|uniref:arylesterase n=1 Tax=Pedobacter faecalis TaxID=3041495 RepID=UPI00254F1152|nr:arylesterase [Pedobacter sp. ELA7]